MRQSPNFVRRWNISSAWLSMTDYALLGVTRFLFYPNHIFGIGEARNFKCLVLIDT